MAPARLSARTDFSSTGGPYGNFVYDGANGPIQQPSATTYAYDAVQKQVRSHGTPLAAYAPRHQFVSVGNSGAHLMTVDGAGSSPAKSGIRRLEAGPE